MGDRADVRMPVGCGGQRPPPLCLRRHSPCVRPGRALHNCDGSGTFSPAAGQVIGAPSAGSAHRAAPGCRVFGAPRAQRRWEPGQGVRLEGRHCRAGLAGV